MAHFARTRRLNLARLGAQPPEDVAVVHTTLLGAVRDVQDSLRKVERAFYGTAGDAEGEIQKWCTSINTVLRDVRMPYFNCAGQIDDIVGYIMEPSRKMKVNIYDINRLKECLKKILDAVPGKLEGITSELRRISNYLEKYCLSFYDIEGAVFLDTCSNYENQRQDYLREITKSIDNVRSLIDRFKGQGIFLQDLSPNAREIARKASCNNMPFLLIFPEACQDVRNTCAIMTTWLAADANYATFLSNDINDLDQKKQDLLKSLREQQHKFHQLKFRQKQCQHDFEKLSVETTRLNEREDELIVDEERLSSETNEIQVDIEMKEYRRDELIKKASNFSTEVLYEKYSEISEGLRTLKLKLPSLKRQLNATKHKLTWIKDKKMEVDEAQRELSSIQEDMIEVEVGKEDKERELKNASGGLELARKIHLYKVSPDVLSRIFHNQPLEASNQRVPEKKRKVKYDPFEKACQIIALHIESHWPQLYRCLPFYPRRGNNTIDRDISAMSQEEARVGPEVTATRALVRWRRFHTRATLDDLQGAVASIQRPDLMRRLQAELHTPSTLGQEDQMSAEEEARLYNIDPSLLPFLKEVERFDELRAANRI